MYGADNISVCHKIIYIASMGIGMTKGQNPIAIHCCNSTHGTKGEVTYGHGYTYRRTRLQNCIRANRHHGDSIVPGIIIIYLNPQRRHFALQHLQALCTKTRSKISSFML